MSYVSWVSLINQSLQKDFAHKYLALYPSASKWKYFKMLDKTTFTPTKKDYIGHPLTAYINKKSSKFKQLKRINLNFYSYTGDKLHLTIPIYPQIPQNKKLGNYAFINNLFLRSIVGLVEEEVKDEKQVIGKQFHIITGIHLPYFKRFTSPELFLNVKKTSKRGQDSFYNVSNQIGKYVSWGLVSRLFTTKPVGKDYFEGMLELFGNVKVPKNVKAPTSWLPSKENFWRFYFAIYGEDFPVNFFDGTLKMRITETFIPQEYEETEIYEPEEYFYEKYNITEEIPKIQKVRDIEKKMKFVRASAKGIAYYFPADYIELNKPVFGRKKYDIAYYFNPSIHKTIIQREVNKLKRKIAAQEITKLYRAYKVAYEKLQQKFQSYPKFKESINFFKEKQLPFLKKTLYSKLENLANFQAIKEEFKKKIRYLQKFIKYMMGDIKAAKGLGKGYRPSYLLEFDKFALWDAYTISSIFNKNFKQGEWNKYLLNTLDNTSKKQIAVMINTIKLAYVTFLTEIQKIEKKLSKLEKLKQKANKLAKLELLTRLEELKTSLNEINKELELLEVRDVEINKEIKNNFLSYTTNLALKFKLPIAVYIDIIYLK